MHSRQPGRKPWHWGGMVLGPWTLQAEWAGQFLPGEHQEHVKPEGVFGRVVPRHNFHCKKGDDWFAGGAWQAGVRFSYLDPNDKAIRGARSPTEPVPHTKGRRAALD
jgi:hypothetical protein